MAKATEITLQDEVGREIGVIVKIDAAGEIEGWSSPFEVDGQPYPFSKARAAALLARYPHFAAQVEKATASKPAASGKDDKE